MNERNGLRAYGTTLPANGGSSSVQVKLTRHGESYTGQVVPVAGPPLHLAGYWALTDNGQTTVVKAGENDGATLAHDVVVRAYRPIAAWSAVRAEPTTLHYNPAIPADGSHPREINLVLVDADSGRPVQAIRLGC